MTDDKLTKIKEEQAKLLAKLQANKEKEKKIKRDRAKREKEERKSWLLIFGELVIANRLLGENKMEMIVEAGKEKLSETNYKKLISGLDKDGIYTKKVSSNFDENETNFS